MKKIIIFTIPMIYNVSIIGKNLFAKDDTNKNSKSKISQSLKIDETVDFKSQQPGYILEEDNDVDKNLYNVKKVKHIKSLNSKIDDKKTYAKKMQYKLDKYRNYHYLQHFVFDQYTFLQGQHMPNIANKKKMIPTNDGKIFELKDKLATELQFGDKGYYQQMTEKKPKKITSINKKHQENTDNKKEEEK